MNDRYLFRAKRIDTGEWIIGNLICSPDGRNAISETGGDWMLHEVDQYTICQCTGLNDKNGRKIFERDIVKVVDTSRKNMVFCIGDISFEEGSWKLCGEILHWLKDAIYFEFEVIGNIFDNPELMEQEG